MFYKKFIFIIFYLFFSLSSYASMQSSLIDIVCYTNPNEIHLGKVKFLLNKGVNPNVRDIYDNGTALMCASGLGKIKIVEALIDSGADINIKQKDGFDALMFAVSYNRTNTAKYLIDNGADMHSFDNDIMINPFLASVFLGNDELVNYFIKKGMDVNLENLMGKNALMIATEEGHTGIVKKLINNGAFINTVNIYGDSSLMYASKSGNINDIYMLYYLSEGKNVTIDLNNRNQLGDSAVSLAEKNGHKKIVEFLKANGAY